MELRRNFDDDLAHVENGLAQLGARVIEATHRSTEVLLSLDVDEAQRIIESDDEMDLLAVTIEEWIHRALALQAPLASDLRLLIAAVKMTSELERSGDLACNIAKGALRLVGVELSPQLRGQIDRMREQVAHLFEVALKAYADKDASAAGALHGLDDQLDELHTDFIETVLWTHASGRIDVQQAVQLCIVGRFYERLGDHAVNVGERIEYLVTGHLPEHSGARRARERHERSGTPDSTD